MSDLSPRSGVKRKSWFGIVRSAPDPSETWGASCQNRPRSIGLVVRAGARLPNVALPSFAALMKARKTIGLANLIWVKLVRTAQVRWEVSDGFEH